MLGVKELHRAVDAYKERAHAFNDDRPLDAPCTIEELDRAVNATADLANLLIDEFTKANA